MPQLVGAKLCELGDKTWRRETSHEYLTGVDANRTVLASVIDLDESSTEIGEPNGFRDGYHGASSRSLAAVRRRVKRGVRIMK